MGKEYHKFVERFGNVHRVDAFVIDINGDPRGKWMPGSALEKACQKGFALPYSVFGLDIWGKEVMSTGLHVDSGDKDGLCLPVLDTLKFVTWSKQPMAQMMFRMCTPEGKPFFGDPFNVLDGPVQRLKQLGFTATCAVELEFYLVTRPQGPSGQVPIPVAAQGRRNAYQQTYGIDELESFQDFFDDLQESAQIQDLPTDAMVSEAAPGQFEVNLKHVTEPHLAALHTVMLRRLVKGVAAKYGFVATFMAKPFAHFPGNGMHVHLSLCDMDGNNAFANKKDGEDLLKYAVAGSLETMADGAALFVSSFNGFRRMVAGGYAPTSICWGTDNRSVAVRIPAERGSATRLEHRISGADANPFFVLAALITGICHGIENKIQPPPPVTTNAYSRTDLKHLPDNMEQALKMFEQSKIYQDMLGEDMMHLFVEVKYAEAEAMRHHITAFEYDTYL